MSTGVQTQVGQFIWHDLLTTDVAKATGFYTELLGWEVETWKPGEVDYPMITANGVQHGGFGALEGDDGSHWIGHVAVEDVDQAIAVSQREGGTIRGEPGGHPEVGSWATIVDPQGGVISAFRPNYDSPPPGGVFVWEELLTTELEGATSFYAAVFGWHSEVTQMGDLGDYTLIKRGDDESVAGALQAPAGAAVSQWYPYLVIDDVDRGLDKANRLGAKTKVEPVQVEGMGRWAVLADPTGAAFGLYQSS